MLVETSLEIETETTLAIETEVITEMESYSEKKEMKKVQNIIDMEEII